MNRAQALHSFWSGFGLKAYDETSVPDNAKLPYITYSVADNDFDQATPLNASLWYRSNSWVEITEKTEQIANSITRGGRMVSYDDGALWICKGNPWAQRMSDPSNYDIRRMLLSVIVEYIN